MHQSITSHVLIYYISGRCRVECWLALQVEYGPVSKHCIMGWV